MKFQLLFFLFSAFIPSKGSIGNGDEVLGIWLIDEGKAKVEIYKEGQKFSGKIVWLKEPRDEQGALKLDKENLDESLRDRPIMGMNLINNFTFDGDDRWVDGEIYDPESGKTYDAYMRFKKGKLEVRGYIGMAMFGRTVVWTRSKL